ncbi:MAG: ribulose-phosphate 3-epimerase [Kiritimatiellae bacterium]|jgi:ribulose-phosphate 3-epimerase|nr:ribulose-phosphate 3-epimerase [Kiritimatiellia bacterium]
MKFHILPSLLAADFGELFNEIKRVESAGADALHLDIMDAHFVPNLSFGPDVVALAKKAAPTLFRNVHLMLSRPDLYVDSFVDAGADAVQIHVEADCDIWQTLSAIRARGVRSGLVMRPQTEIAMIKPYLSLCDEVLFMTVNPGYGGQSFMTEVLPKIAALRDYVKGGNRNALDIMVDGGINFETGVQCAAHGANMFVAGSFLFKQDDMGSAVMQMRDGCAAVERK